MDTACREAPAVFTRSTTLMVMKVHRAWAGASTSCYDPTQTIIMLPNTKEDYIYLATYLAYINLNFTVYNLTAWC